MEKVKSSARTWAEIDLDAIKHNLDIAKNQGMKVMCVIKGNAYGHGSVGCAKFLEENGADMFAVACLSEALELREAGVMLNTLVLGYTTPEYAKTIADNNITQTIVDEEAAQELSDAAVEAGVVVNAHIKIDTGMSRLGIFAQGEEAAKKAADAVIKMYDLPGINITGMYTHFSTADMPGKDEFQAWQMNNFKIVMDRLVEVGKKPPVCHTGNSACILKYPETYIDMIRMGIMLYGMYPDSKPREDGELMPAMSLKTRVSQVRELPPGCLISYGCTYCSRFPMKVATITAGYADGYPRRMSNGGYVVINGVRCEQIGRVCMDMMMV
ncbi:MAG: alanine racemase, partial [Clostridia bacterium]|nr:alanine racemase [Clostridia bacterium]